MSRKTPVQEEAQTRTETLCELADEAGEFTMQDLAMRARTEDVYTDVKLDRLMDLGVMSDVKRSLKSQKDNEGCPIYVAISTGPGAIWKRWSLCSRVESRYAIQIRAVQNHASDETLRKLKQAHEKRFREDLTTPKLTRPRDWDPSTAAPPVERWTKDDPRR